MFSRGKKWLFIGVPVKGSHLEGEAGRPLKQAPRAVFSPRTCSRSRVPGDWEDRAPEGRLPLPPSEPHLAHTQEVSMVMG